MYKSEYYQEKNAERKTKLISVLIAVGVLLLVGGIVISSLMGLAEEAGQSLLLDEIEPEIRGSGYKLTGIYDIEKHHDTHFYYYFKAERVVTPSGEVIEQAFCSLEGPKYLKELTCEKCESCGDRGD